MVLKAWHKVQMVSAMKIQMSLLHWVVSNQNKIGEWENSLKMLGTIKTRTVGFHQLYLMTPLLWWV